MEESDIDAFEKLKRQRQIAAKNAIEENDLDRLRSKEKVKNAQTKFLTRELDNA